MSDGDTRQEKDEAGPKDGNAQNVEHGGGDFRRPRLQPDDSPGQEEVGDGNHQKQEQHGKETHSESSDAVAQDERADPDKHHGKNRDGELVIFARQGGVSWPDRVEQSAGDEQAESPPPMCLGMGEDPLPF